MMRFVRDAPTVPLAAARSVGAQHGPYEEAWPAPASLSKPQLLLTPTVFPQAGQAGRRR